jgi:hypothetical protein
VGVTDNVTIMRIKREFLEIILQDLDINVMVKILK